ncbi:hypothetical protein KO498_09670 [Lentibacter algarum]|uniref:hypothetical protein n=1 Tax=Lentibacter algarum TaxID=576131 RepID=UPI001C075E59|nr:hypothetical protein [Lentibacter algarum]MBU2982078.1 hypothetical protein [Lentibacter algarum]
MLLFNKKPVQTAVICLLALGVSGCEQAKDKLTRNSYYYEGVTFKSKIVKSKESRENFQVIIRNATLGLTGAREAARLAANRYCIENYGSTDITYGSQSPDTENEDLVLNDGQLVLDGKCAGW